ncbi:unnamed protein product, partial [Staurois parvus]
PTCADLCRSVLLYKCPRYSILLHRLLIIPHIRLFFFCFHLKFHLYELVTMQIMYRS